jgi:CheY-like chemotaxis protein
MDERRLRQVLLNLLANAVKFTDNGEVMLEVTSPASGRIRFEVRDTGIGIGPDQVGSLFQPFEQVGTVQRRREGTGLGLAISRELVHLMGGDLKVESRVGAGSTFWFELAMRIASPAPAVGASGLPVCGYTGAAKAVLVVDDDPQSRAVLVDLLAPLGFRVTEAADGFEALERARAVSFDLVLTDLSMPGMGGTELVSLLRQLADGKSLPIAVVSARGSEPHIWPSSPAPINGFLSKPINVDEVLATIGSLLGLEWTYAPERVESAVK